MKILKIVGILLLICYLVFSLYAGVRLNTKCSTLEDSLDMEKRKADIFYGQIQELSFILENASPALDKTTIQDGINKFTDSRHEQFKKDSIPIVEIPRTLPKSSNILYGYHSELRFHFYENGRLKKIEYPKYEPSTIRIN